MAPRITKATLTDRTASEVVQLRLMAREVHKSLPAVIERNIAFVSKAQAASLTAGLTALAALVPVLDAVYVSDAAPSSDLRSPPPGVPLLGGAAPTLKAMFRGCERLAKTAAVSKLVPQIVEVRDALTEMIKVTDLFPEYGEREPWQVQKSATPAPLRKGVTPGVLHLHVIGKSMHLDFRFADEEQSGGWMIEAARSELIEAPSLEQVREIGKAFSPLGSRLFKALKTAGAAAQLKPGAGAPWLKVKELAAPAGEVGASALEKGVVLAIGAPVIEPGMQTAGLVEYFLSKSRDPAADPAGPLLGIMQFQAVSPSEQKWKAVHLESALPHVLTAEAVLAKAMPAEGTSALPASLEKLVPAEHMYWMKKGEEARTLRDLLVESGYFTDANVLVVDGQLERITTKSFLTLPLPRTEPPAGTPISWPLALLKLAGSLPTVELRDILIVDRLEPFTSGELALTTADDVADLILVQPTQALTDVAKALAPISKLRSEVLVAVPDSPEARMALEKVGPAFTFPLTMPGMVLAASFPVADVPGLERVDKAKKKTAFSPDYDQDTQAYEPASSVNLAAKSSARVQALLAKMRTGDRVIALKKDTATTTPATDEATEERFVLGIVLEPDVVDSQKDTYSADEIRKAAHLWMAEYRMLGRQHKEKADTKMQILESYIAPVDFTINGTVVKAGTWLLGVRVTDDALWKDIQDGKVTGWSIGGSALRTPDPASESLPAATAN